LSTIFSVACGRSHSILSEGVDLSELYLKHKNLAWWTLAAVLGLLALQLPNFLPSGIQDESLALILTHVFLLIFAAVIGYLNPTRVWRWGIASVLLFPIQEAIAILIESRVTPSSPSLLESISYLFVKVPVYAIESLPAFAGAYLGAFARRRFKTQPEREGQTDGEKLFMISFCLGIFAGWAPLLITHDPVPMRLWAIGLFLSAAGMSLVQSKRAWRWGLAVAFGLPVLIFFRAFTDPNSTHNLWPIEILFALVLALPTACAGAYFGKLLIWIKKKIISRTGST
jgi:hypothetical protein